MVVTLSESMHQIRYLAVCTERWKIIRNWVREQKGEASPERTKPLFFKLWKICIFWEMLF